MLTSKPSNSHEVTIDQRLHELKFYEFVGDPCYCKPEYLKKYNQLYNFWKFNTLEALKSEQNFEKILSFSSDDYVAQKALCGLFYKSEPIGFCGFDWKNILADSFWDTKYIKDYPQDIIEDSIKIHQKIMSVFFMTVDPNWRKNKIGFGVSEILTGLSSHHLIHSDAAVMIFFTRNNRKTNRLSMSHGGVKIKDNLNSYNTEADIVATYRDAIKPCFNAEIQGIIDRLWVERIRCSCI